MSNIKRLGMMTMMTLTLVLGIFIGTAFARQGHMDAARDFLKSAKGELEAAEHDKGGHRKVAINLINQAITEVNLGIQSGR